VGDNDDAVSGVFTESWPVSLLGKVSPPAVAPCVVGKGFPILLDTVSVGSLLSMVTS